MPPNGSSSEKSSDSATSGQPQTQVTQLLLAWKDGDGDAIDQLLPLVYDELRRQARYALGGEAVGHTLQTTALVHEAYVRLVGADLQWEGSRHFMRIAARAMRRVLVDHARARKSKKRGGGAQAVAIDTLEGMIPAEARPEHLLELDEALERLLQLNERTGRAIELHYFGGLSHKEVADALEISPATVDRDLRFGRAWLYKELQRDG